MKHGGVGFQFRAELEVFDVLAFLFQFRFDSRFEFVDVRPRVGTENLIRVDDTMELVKLAQ
jgi:hypothetical protein